MKKMIFFTLISIFLFNCTPQRGDESKSKYVFYNIIVLLDLSDRIKSDEQVDRDKKIISNLLDLFSNRQGTMGYQSLDEFSVNIIFQKNSKIAMSDIVDNLHIKMETAKGRDDFESLRHNLLIAVDTLYSRAEASPTTGSDLWSFFRDNMQLLIEQTDSVKNYIFQNKCIVLSDGYLQFDKGTYRQTGTYMPISHLEKLRKKTNWEEIYESENFGLRPIKNMNYSNLQVMMLEVTPQNPVENINELPILKKYWGDWMNKMGIQNEIYPKEDNIENIRDKTIEFLKKNI